MDGGSLEFLLIGESKIKIVLNEEESKKYKLDTSSQDSCGAEVRRSFWQVLDMAKAQVGFDPSGDKILIQLYPLSSGGCELFVTKLGILPQSSARIVSKSDRVALLSRRQNLYVFDSLTDLSSCAVAIKNITRDFTPRADVYFASDKYYLSIEEYGKGGEPTEFPCVLEFGRELTADSLAYILEHATCLTNGDGIDKFAGL